VTLVIRLYDAALPIGIWMNTVYELRRQPLASSATHRRYANRLVDAEGHTLFTGETRRGYATSAVTFTAVEGHQVPAEITFGRNRRVAGTAFELKAAGGGLIARIETGVVQRSWSGPAFPVQGGRGDELFSLVPAEKLVDGLVGSLGRWADDDLILHQGTTTIGYTGNADPMRQANPAADLGRRLLRNAGRLSVELGGRVIDTLRGKKIDHPEVSVGRLTLLPEATKVDPPLALAVLLFKVHYFELRTPS
jgi:hypothetical protein